MRKSVLAGLVLILGLPATASAQSAYEVRAAKAVLAKAQARSIAENREYCGYLGYSSSGALVSTRPRRGNLDECTPNWPRNIEVVASWHTHAAYDEGAWSEVPTVNDIEADEAEGVDGYISTPGGRVWYVDTTDMVVSQLCGLGCIRSDPRFKRGAEGQIQQSYTYRQLLRREAN